MQICHSSYNRHKFFTLNTKAIRIDLYVSLVHVGSSCSERCISQSYMYHVSFSKTYSDCAVVRQRWFQIN